MSDISTSVPLGSRLPVIVRDPRARLLTFAGVTLVAGFWFLTRYPALMHKAEGVSGGVASMAFATQLWVVGEDASFPMRILAGAVNWLDAMKIGMSFGVLFGALLHTTLRYFPMKVGKNVTLNSMKGALVGMPMGVCANCAVPTACGVTRGNGRLEVALGFLFSSPNFNPVVVMMTVAALPAAMVITKYAVLVLMIVVGVPILVKAFGGQAPESTEDVIGDGEACAMPDLIAGQKESLVKVARELAGHFRTHIWMLAKPTLAIMLIASLLSSTALVLLPLDEILANPSFLSMGLVSTFSTLMPVPIALDVMFAAQLQAAGTAPGYVMLFAMTLGTYSIVPTIFLWREVSKRLAMSLLGFFLLLGWALAWIFQMYMG